MKMVKVRDMLRVQTRGNTFIVRPLRAITAEQKVEVREKIALLKVAGEHGKIKGVGVRFSASIFYIDLEGFDNVG